MYPILAFLAHTLPGGGSPSWITQGTYMSSASNADVGGDSLVSSLQGKEPASPQLGEGGGVLRSNLANEEFIKWLPETMLAFAEQTGAGGFSFVSETTNGASFCTDFSCVSLPILVVTGPNSAPYAFCRI